MTLSVVIVSHSRTAALMRCIDGLGQLDTACFEVVVVADQASVGAIGARGDGSRLKICVFDELNISAARNVGIRNAAGEIIAFIDDDAVAEPTWLDRLVAPFKDPAVTSTGGFVLGRNGVSLQWGASQADAAGRAYPCAPSDPLGPGCVWRTEGTSMAMRRNALAAVGGFDEAFQFFLDETDLNWRMPGTCVICPDAVVHHGFLESQRRRGDRVPRDLRQIGASTAVFLREHAGDQMQQRYDEVRREQRLRLLRHMVSGRLEPRDVRRLLAGLEAGFAEGVTRPSLRAELSDPQADFLPYRAHPPGPRRMLAGPARSFAQLWQDAQTMVAEGLRPTVITFGLSARPLQVSFESPGVWVHKGGVWGKAERDRARPRPARVSARIDAEQKRITPRRGPFEQLGV